MHATIIKMKPREVNPGLLAIFRLFTAIRLVLGLLALVVIEVGLGPLGQTRLPTHWMGLGEAVFTLVYLSLPGLPKKLGKLYLPIALAASTVGPIFSTSLAIDPGTSLELGQARLAMGQWQLVILLLVPLILISWQYGFKAVVFYTLAMAIFDILPAVFLFDQDKVRLYLGISIFIFRTLFYCLIGYAIARLADEQRKQNARLEEANRQLASYASTLEQLTISRERNRLARELHDTLAHTLSGLAVQLEAVEALWEAEPGKSRRMLQDSLGHTRSGLKEARRAIQALRATPLEDLGLNLALEGLARSEAERTGMTLELQLPDVSPKLRPEVEHGLYRIAEEALRNASQHAKASKLVVRMSQKDGKLELLVQDDGRGFDPSQPPPADRFGLRGIQERAAAIGGQIRLDSQLGKGTSITLSLEAEA